MPHAVLDKPVDLVRFAEKFVPIFKKDNYLIKIENIFVDMHKRTALLPTVVIDSEKQNFFVEILSGGEKTTVRLFPLTDPKKTYGVKSALGLVAASLLKQNQDLVITKTNIREFI